LPENRPGSGSLTSPITSEPLARCHLERDGLVDRHVYATIPPKVEYRLTPLGQSLEDAIATVRRWAYSHMDEITESRDRYDRQPA
jgi:DNA-binding HxlR family transcriptional regulator